MSSTPLDSFLQQWRFEPGPPQVRRAVGDDGREVLLLRVDLGLLQLETAGRPDGERPGGFPTCYDYVMSLAFERGPEFALDADLCAAIDREFYQYYHRRICWLALQEYVRAAEDAEHTLRLMDFAAANAPHRQWAAMHEQYRPFVLFHRIQASALDRLQQDDPAGARTLLDEGLIELRQALLANGADEAALEEELFVRKLGEMRAAVESQFRLGPTIAQQLADAIAAEQYELAAKLRDELERSRRRP